MKVGEGKVVIANVVIVGAVTMKDCSGRKVASQTSASWVGTSPEFCFV